MKRLIVLCVIHPLIALPGPCMSSEIKGIRVDAYLMQANKTLSHDYEEYYPNENGIYNRDTIPYESVYGAVNNPNRITISKVTIDTTAKIATVMYGVRLGQGNKASIKEQTTEIKFNASGTTSFENGIEAKIALSKIKSRNTISMTPTSDSMETIK